MLRTTNAIGLSTILQSLIAVADKDNVDASKSDGNKTNLSNLFTFKKSIGAGYLTSKGSRKGSENSKKGSHNTKKCVKADRGSNYLTPNTKKIFNHLRHAFTQAPILYHFNPK